MLKKILLSTIIFSAFLPNLSSPARPQPDRWLAGMAGGRDGLAYRYPDSTGKIKALQGVVQISEAEKAGEKPAEVGMPISASNVISTGPHSYCVVQLDENNIFRIKQNAKVKIEKIWDEVHKSDGSVVKEVRLDLMRGELTAKLDQLPAQSEFNVSGPVAIAGAAGTAYTVNVDEESQRTQVTVLDHQVTVESMNEPNKMIKIQKFQRVEASPWPKALLKAQGRGVLSEAILGKSFAREAEQNIQIQAVGAGKSPEEAKLQSLYRLSKMILQLHVDQETSLESVMAKDPILTQKVYSAISNAQVLDSSQRPDGDFQVKVEINLPSLNQALGHPLFGMTQSVIPITLSEYSQKFGALARVTTQRAAQVEGYRNLAEIIHGTVINATTTVEDFAVKDDTIRTSVQGTVKGAVIVNTQHFSDGSIIVDLEIRGELIPENLSPRMGDIFGQNYLSGPQLIEFGGFEDYLNLEKSTKWQVISDK